MCISSEAKTLHNMIMNMHVEIKENSLCDLIIFKCDYYWQLDCYSYTLHNSFATYAYEIYVFISIYKNKGN